MSYVPHDVIEKLEAAFLELPEASTLLAGIQELDSSLKQADIYLKETKSHITIRDRVNVQRNTSEEEMEKDLQGEIREHYQKMTDMLARIDKMLLEVAGSLAGTDELVRKYMLWSELHRLKLLISQIHVDPFFSGDMFGYSIRGRDDCTRLVTKLEEMTRLSKGDPITMGALLDQAKKKLLEDHGLSSKEND